MENVFALQYHSDGFVVDTKEYTSNICSIGLLRKRYRDAKKAYK